MVILDPAWRLKWLRDHSSSDRHNLFHAVGSNIIGDATDVDPAYHPLSQSVPPIEHALLCIMHTIAGDEGKARVQDFLDQFADVVRVARPPE